MMKLRNIILSVEMIVISVYTFFQLFHYWKEFSQFKLRYKILLILATLFFSYAIFASCTIFYYLTADWFRHLKNILF